MSAFGRLSKSRAIWLAVIVAGGVVLFWGRGFIGLADGQSGSKERVAAIEPVKPAASDEQSVDLTAKQAASIKIGPVPSRDFALLKTAVGTIDFNENLLVQVFSQYQGKILKAFYNIGEEVKAGEVLFTIDSPDLLQAESTLLAAAGVLELQKKTLARLTNLMKSGGSAQKDVDQSTSDQQTAEGNFKAAKDAVRIFGKSDAEIEQILNDRRVDSTLVVPSPIGGRVVARNAAPGFLTQPGAAPAPFTVADLSTMWMLANVIETDAPAYKLGQQVQVTVPAYPDKVFTGRVTALGAMIDPNTHRQLVRSEIDDPEHLLRSGMFASFVIHVGDPVRSLAVPAEGVVREGDGTMSVWATKDSRHFVKRTVKTGMQQDGWTQILTGLMPDETVVTDGAVFLSNKLLLGDAG
ncbi:efflux RND transporter periplasmic adaptor subunit [Bradyrhizobium erythrophlei]|uniref:Membrane fusion protein, cobalt-zinc-cadmium efflux system n=1 Tax=Bradyrhizobium erythrophlei TaxID=1437360 RepID=A0A1M7U8Y8_9BRAD|nr:efflux RND transporter periplasmic adaptor subunit [Bradyrhizobium erythrophlei]SHN79414.1 membrane fusion protein, cobalt-zinc-cadmium efflux system [Bradyrhizobium erythrophlei]